MVVQEYNDFRHQCLEQYVEFTRNVWKEYNGRVAEPLPFIKKVSPIEYKSSSQESSHDRIGTPTAFDQIITMERERGYRHPMPISPIPEVSDENIDYYDFTFYGTHLRVRIDEGAVYHVAGVNESQVADALKILVDGKFDNTIRDCLEIRYDMQLSDWAYLQMLRLMAERVYGKESNEAILLAAYIYMQSGYM